MERRAFLKPRKVLVGLIFLAAASIAVVLPALAGEPNDATEISDRNNDGVVDHADLVLFSSEYLEMDAETVDWCAFVDATKGSALLYGRQPSFYTKHFGRLIEYVNAARCELSDLNGDGKVNARDLMAFSEKYIGQHFLKVDWCPFLDGIVHDSPQYGHPADYYLEAYGPLMLYLQDRFSCVGGPEPDALALENSPRFLARIAAARDLSGSYYITDPKVGSVFIFDSDMKLTQELKGLEKPLGIAVNSLGHILVGNDKSNTVEVYDPETGEKLAAFGVSELEKPTSIEVDSWDRIYVTDAQSNTVYVYDSDYSFLMSIGEPGTETHQLRSPMDAALSPDESEIFVLDQLNRRINVYDLAGNHLRTLNAPERCFFCKGKAAFTRLQALEVDASGNLHVLDVFDALVAIMNPDTGLLVGKYGAYGLDQGKLKSPMDLLLATDQALVTDGGKNSVEYLALP